MNRLADDAIRRLCPRLPPSTALKWSMGLTDAAEEFDITKPTWTAMWLAQLLHESAKFERLVENLNYSARRLSQVWPARFAENPRAIELGPNTLAKSIEHNPEQIANVVYANRIGNGPAFTGDGWRFRGRYPLQLTGRANYQACNDDISVPDMLNPDALLLDIHGMCRVCGWFWRHNRLGPIADEGLLEPVVRKWNGGLIGIEDRARLYRDCMIAMGMA